MATYEFDIDPLPQLAFANGNDHPAAAIAAGDNLNPAHVAAATNQHKNRKTLSKMSPPQATNDEVLASKRRKYQVEAANFLGPTPPWAQSLQQSMQDMGRDIQDMKNKHLQDMQQIMWRIEQTNQLSMNRSRRNNSSPIEALLRLQDGEFPNQVPHNLWFPDDQRAIFEATGPNVHALLTFYGLSTNGTILENQERLESFLGLTL